MEERPPSRLPLYVGVLLIAGGWGVLYVGWWQAGRQELETGQLPYVLSGGFGSAGLILMGAAGILLWAVRRALWAHRQSLEGIRSELDRLSSVLKEARESEEEKPPRRRRTTTRKRKASSS